MTNDENYSPIHLARIAILTVVTGLVASFAGKPMLVWAMGASTTLAIAWFFWEKAGLYPPSRYPRTAFIPTFLDLASLTALAYFTGGLSSFAIAGHYFPIAIGSTNKRINHGLYALLVSFTMIAAMGALELLGAGPVNVLGPAYRLSPLSMAFILACWLAVGSALHIMIRGLRLREAALESRIRESEAMHRLLAERSRERDETIKLLLSEAGKDSLDCIWETDPSGIITSCPPELAARLGAPDKSLEGSGIVEALADASQGDEGARDLLSKLSSVLSMAAPFSELSIRFGGVREPKYWRLAGRPKLEADGSLLGWRLVGRDVTGAVVHAEELERLAWVDQPTGLGNRADLLRRMDSFFAADGGASALLALIHIENMKLVNSVFGHTMGDEALAVFGRRVKFICGEFSGASNRVDGADFAIFIAQTGPSTLDDLENSIQILREPVVLGAQVIELEVRIGAATTGVDADSTESLLQAAEGALNLARSSRSSQTRRFDAEMAAVNRRAKDILGEFQDAMDRKEFRLLYQPQVDTSTGLLASAESLVRWHNQKLGLVSPGEFIPVAERNGYIVSLGAWIQFQACKDALLWPRPWRVAVNVAAAQLLNRNFSRSVLQILENAKLPPERLKVEITESAMIAESGQVREQLERLRAERIRIALDDFGTGYSSMSYLKELPIDELKIDQSFVRAIDGTERSMAIVATIIRLAKSLGLSITAEGAETDTQTRALRELGCDYIQGYFYSKPIPADDLVAFGTGLESSK